MVGRNKTILAVMVIAVLAIVAIILIFVLNNGSSESDASKSNTRKPSTSTTNKQSTSDPDIQESTSTTLVLDDISISLSTPVADQQFANASVPVRAIIEGATSGTCTLTLTRNGSEDIVLEAPVISAPTYFTCQGFDVEPSKFKDKGEWTLELSVTSPDGKTGSEKRKISVS